MANLRDDLQVLLGHELREPASTAEADQIIKIISGLNGIIPFREDDSVFQLIAGKSRRSEEKLIRMQKVRVLFELIQNADDANHEPRPHTPSLSFTLEPDRLTIDTNERGFTLANVLAICTVGESSKKKTNGDSFIGEKGFGFKSVFSVSSSVFIQSGFWSFCFNYEKDKPSSMIAPSAAAHDRVRQPGTRIVLKLEPNKARKLYYELQSLPDTTIAFLRRLSKIEIHVQNFDPSGPIKNFARGLIRHVHPIPHRLTIPQLNSEILSVTSLMNGQPAKKQVFRLCKQSFGTMPVDKLRRNVPTTQVQLGFPIDEASGQPQISPDGQCIFAFLPLTHQERLPFLIQADWITTASREDVIDCDWNDRLLEHVLNTFIKSMKHFVFDNVHMFKWLEFLPKANLRGHWQPLKSLIEARLSSESIFLLASGTQPTTTTKMKILPSSFQTDEGPLLKDIVEPTIYTNQRYHRHGVEAQLVVLGIERLSLDEILDRIDHDLSLATSQIRTSELDCKWHGQFGALIQDLMSATSVDGRTTAGPSKNQNIITSQVTRPGTHQALRRRLMRMNIVPLSDGTWASPDSEIYFSSLDDQPIPGNLGYNLLHPNAMKTAEQMALYRLLGVSDCNPAHVCKTIIYNQRGLPEYQRGGVAIDYVHQFRFLFRFQETLGENTKQIIKVATSGARLTTCADSVYFVTHNKYDTKQLIKSISPSVIENSSFNTDIFLHKQYVEQCPRWTSYNRTWERWLLECASIRYYPPLHNPQDADALNPLVEMVLKSDSALFLGLLEHRWLDSYQTEIKERKILQQSIRGATVRCFNGTSRPLKHTYFPSAALVSQTRELGLFNNFPFLELPDISETLDHPEDQEKWMFLTNFQVCFRPEYQFYLDLMLCLKNSTPNVPEDGLSRVMRIYQQLEEHANGKTEKILIDLFHRSKLCLEGGTETAWKSPAQCIWEGPDFLEDYLALQSNYGHSSILTEFFVNRLKIRNANYEDVIKQLRSWKQSGLFARVGPDRRWSCKSAMFVEVYQELAALSSPHEHLQISTIMTADELIFADDKWLSSSKCIWDSHIDIPGVVRLSRYYPNLKEFFVGTLSIRTATAPAIAQSWVDVASSEQPDVQSIRELMTQLSYLIAKKDLTDPALLQGVVVQLTNIPCLPIREKSEKSDSNGENVKLGKMSSDFFIVDHGRCGRLFSGTVAMLAFDLEESLSLQPLFEYLNLWHRRLSCHINESSPRPQTTNYDQSRTAHFRDRCFAFAWCATKFSSPGFGKHEMKAYDRLKGLTILTSPDLQTKLELRVDAKSVTSIASNQTKAYIRDSSSEGIEIILPTEERANRSCMRSQIPRELRKILRIADVKAEYYLHLLLQDTLQEVHDVLEELDIPPVSWIPAPKTPEMEPILPARTFGDSAGCVCESPQRLSLADKTMFSQGTQSTSSESVTTESRSERKSTSLTSVSSVDSWSRKPDQYAQLLKNLLGNARDESSVQPASFSATDVFGRDKKRPDALARIDAAGEMFVFENLRRSSIPFFDYSNWQSDIRHHVSCTDEFHDLQQYDGCDRNIVYVDQAGLLEPLLRIASSNEFPSFDDAAAVPGKTVTPIKFIIQVKTTVGGESECMSLPAAQYELMHSCKIVDGRRPAAVYVLIRISGLLSGNPGCKVFVDPARLAGGTLQFAPAAWTVAINDDGSSRDMAEDFS